MNTYSLFIRDTHQRRGCAPLLTNGPKPTGSGFATYAPVLPSAQHLAASPALYFILFLLRGLAAAGFAWRACVCSARRPVRLYFNHKGRLRPTCDALAGRRDIPAHI